MKLVFLIVALLICQPVVARIAVSHKKMADPQNTVLQMAATVAANVQPAEDLTTLPLEKGLPVIVRLGVYYQDVKSFNENEDTFKATLDSRLRWEDPRLRYPESETPRGFQEYRGPKAEEKLKTIWSPGVAFTNMIDNPSYQVSSVRIFPDGWVELMQRTTGQFSMSMDTGNFPFDRQALTTEVEIRRETTNEASLISLQEDLDFSLAAPEIVLKGWNIGVVNVKRINRQGWYGDFHSALVFGLDVKRQTAHVMAPIFIPLIASLLIPMVGLWMNSIEDGDFTVEAFELANVIVGGLFAVIALNFSINSSYTIIASGDNTVSRLFELNYVALGVVLGIVIFMYRYNTLKRHFGAYVQEECFLFLLWAVPTLSFGTAAAFICAAMAG